jgi:hypothetical protein
MRIWDHPNTSCGWACPICGTADDRPVTLIGVSGTEDGCLMQAEQYHVDCIDLTTMKLGGGKHLIHMLYQPKAKGE